MHAAALNAWVVVIVVVVVVCAQHLMCVTDTWHQETSDVPDPRKYGPCINPNNLVSGSKIWKLANARYVSPASLLH